VRPGEGGGRARDAGAGVDALGKVAGWGGGAAEGSQQPKCRTTLAQRGETPGAPCRGRAPGVGSRPVLTGSDAERARVPDEPQEGPADRGVELWLAERAHRPGSRRVEPRVGISGAPHQASRTFEPSSAASAAGDCVGEVVARWTLLVIGAIAPGRGSGAITKLVGERVGGEIGCPGGHPNPAGGISLGGASRHGRPGVVEARRGIQVKSREKARDAARLPAVTGGLERQRDRRRVTWPDVGPAVAGASGDRAGAPVGQRAQHEQRAPVHLSRPPRRFRAERSCPAQPAAVAAARAGEESACQGHDGVGCGSGRADHRQLAPPSFLQAPSPRAPLDVDRDFRPDPHPGRFAHTDQPSERLPSYRVGDLDLHGSRPTAPERKDGARPHHIRPRQVPLANPLRLPHRPPGSLADPDQRHDPGPRRHAPGRLPVRRVVDQCRARRPGRPQVDDVAIGVDRSRKSAIPHHGGPHERWRQRRQRRRRARVGPRSSRRRRQPRCHGGEGRKRDSWGSGPDHTAMQPPPFSERSLAFLLGARGFAPPGEVAQLVEHTTENRGVAGSIPALAIK
jgi:hypothetical protein